MWSTSETVAGIIDTNRRRCEPAVTTTRYLRDEGAR